jgi:formylglycine-generating enzyme required for sulfatase activity
LDLGPPFGLANHPVVGITWYEALAYTRWLTERWCALGFIGADQGVALPSEPEWEKAARGGLEIVQSGSEHARPRPARSRLPTLDVLKDPLAPNAQPERCYPWGPDPDPNRANYRDTGIGTTSAVGIFPGGASPYGCEEMSGNCWEWTRSLWGHYPYPESPGDLKRREAIDASRGQARVLRGGGFDDDAWSVRCASRDRLDPDSRGRLVGFRVVVRPLL